MRNIFKIQGNAILEEKYQGAGMAVGAALNGQLIDFFYLRDLFPEMDDEDMDAIEDALANPTLAPAVRKLQALGDVYVGMCSCYEFIEI